MTLPWGERTYVMGVLNLTPDSFSDGGRLSSVEAVLRQPLSVALIAVVPSAWFAFTL